LAPRSLPRDRLSALTCNEDPHAEERTEAPAGTVRTARPLVHCSRQKGTA